jgi:hypothetical protein
MSHQRKIGDLFLLQLVSYDLSSGRNRVGGTSKGFAFMYGRSIASTQIAHQGFWKQAA